MINTKNPLYSGKVYLKNLFDLGGKIDLDNSLNSFEPLLNQRKFKAYRQKTSLALDFQKAYDIYKDRFPLTLESNERNRDTNLKCFESLFIRIYSSGVCAINLILSFSDASLPTVKTCVNKIMNVFEKGDTSVIFDKYPLSEYAQNLIIDLKKYITFFSESETETAKRQAKRKKSVEEIRKENADRISIGISVVYIPSNLSNFDDSKAYMDNYGRHLHSNLLVRGPVREEKTISDVLSDPNLKLLPMRYTDELIMLGRHALLVYAPSRSKSFIDGSELTYERARVQRFLIKVHSNVARIYTNTIDSLISNKNRELHELEDTILEINRLRVDILSTTGELTDYPSMIVNIHLTKIFQETLDIGYGDFEFNNLEKSIDNLDELVRNIYEVLKIRNEHVTQRELTRLQLIFVMGVAAQLLAFLTYESGFYLTSVFWIFSSILFAIGIFVTIRLLTRMKR